MYLPRAFREDRLEILHELVRSHPLGLLISSGPQGLQASPLPFLLYPDEGEYGVLRAHLARANTHWRDLSGIEECLVVFQGPGNYVTPGWYPGKARDPRAVPTWNYASVQIRGRPCVREDAAWLARQLADLSRHHEQIRPRPWSIEDLPPDFLEAQLRAIVGIEIPIRRIDGKFKMSQNRQDEDRAGVIRGLRDANDPHRNDEVADVVERAAAQRPAR